MRLASAIRALMIAFLLAIGMASSAQQPDTPGWASDLYRQLETVKLDPDRVYLIRDAALNREDLHIIFHDGTIGFTRAVDGHITGAIFEGTGEVLLIPPDRVERWSLSVFTGSAILEEAFNSAYIRFNDDTFKELEPSLRPTDGVPEFLDTWEPMAETLAHNMVLRLVETFVNGTTINPDGSKTYARDADDRFLLARVSGVHSGLFDVFYDTKAAEQIGVAHLARAQTNWYYDLWTSFPARSRRNAAAIQKGNRTSSETIANQTGAEAFPEDPVRIEKYKLLAKVLMPRALDVDATLDLKARRASGRCLHFELSRYLKVSSVTFNDNPVEFIQNQALRGTDLERRGNDIVSVILPKAMQSGEEAQLHFVYQGDVLADAGGGLMYVGDHGDWYPNRGIAMANYDVEFQYPLDLTLVATGKRATAEHSAPISEQVSRWISERPIPFAGFNLGRYVVQTAKIGNIEVKAFATKGVESSMNQQQTVIVIPSVRPGIKGGDVIISSPPSPASNAERIAREGAHTIDFYSKRIGPYPYSSLELTQMPGTDSQSWPGLIYLSSYVYLTSEERFAARVLPIGDTMYQHLMEQHEIGHQWWGDLLIWKSYREQWIIEALSNYCALLKLESENENKFNLIMNHYRDELLAKNANGVEVTEAGPVTLGIRLDSSRFPYAYNTISYGRGTWLFHMLRTMLLNPGPPDQPNIAAGDPDEPFFRVLRKLRQRFEGKEITTHDVQEAFEEELPTYLRYEGRKSLDWFFDGWVNGTSIPKFSLADVRVYGKAEGMTATGRILVKNGTEGLVTSVPVYASTAAGHILLGRVFVEGSETAFRFTAPSGTKKLLLDPYGTVLSRP